MHGSCYRIITTRPSPSAYPPVSAVISFVIGIVISAGTRWSITYTVFALANLYKRVDEAMSEHETLHGMVTAHDDALYQHQPALMKKLRAIIILGAVRDFLFYGSFLWGVLYPIRGLAV